MGEGRSSVRDAAELWAITSFFNPFGYKTKSANYRRFREHLKAPLLAVELGYGPGFELDETAADILIQLPGRDILWQKERLLNVALAALPQSCRKVAWVDCDVIFEADDWSERTRALLDEVMLAQPYSHAHRMPRGWTPGNELPADASLRRSAPFLLSTGMSLADCMGRPAESIGCSLGYAWAARRDLLEAHHFYDACIIGGGDAAIVRAAYGCFEEATRAHHMNLARAEHFLQWARPFHAAVRGRVSFVSGNLFHLWHGESGHRSYRERQRGFAAFGFDPRSDIAIEEGGAWRWNSEKPEMHDYVRGYLGSRREDG
jgi:hypothetical protein